MRPVVLDVTRTLSPKSIATPTGIDRVERAYIEYFLNIESDVRFLCREAVIDRAGMGSLFSRVRGVEPWGPRDLRGIGRGLSGQISADIRRFSGADLPEGFTYLNVGHSNLERVGRLGADRVIGLVHDLIPLSHPQFQTAASVAQFEARMKHLASAADLILTGTHVVASEVSALFEVWGSSPQIEVNPLGIRPVKDAPPLESQRPAFVVLGTIEPRKNHGLLLDVWEGFADIPEAERPVLHIIGRRGWMNEALFARLDQSPMMGRDVFEHGALPDAEVARYLRGADVLLFPSFVEGFGLPLLEAMSVGLPTLASDIPAFRELAGPLSLYLNPFDVTVWRKAIMKQSKQEITGPISRDGVRAVVPNWPDHFARLERFL